MADLEMRPAGEFNDVPVTHQLNSWMHVPVQWFLAGMILVLIVVHIIVFGPGGTMGPYILYPEYMISGEGAMHAIMAVGMPILICFLGHAAALGFMSPTVSIVKAYIPLIANAIFIPIFALNGALIPWVTGTCGASFLLILCLFNVGVEAPAKGGKMVVDYDYAKYRGYVSLLLVNGNGITNAVGFLLYKHGLVTVQARWAIAFILSPTVLLIPALIKIAKGQPNGQYECDTPTFFRLFITTRLGIYFAMYYLVQLQFEYIMTAEALANTNVPVTAVANWTVMDLMK